MQIAYDRRVDLVQLVLPDRQHAAGTGGGIVERPDHAGLRQRIVIARKQAMDDELDDLPRREVLPGGLVGSFRKLPDQLLENQAHRFVGHSLGVQVDAGKLLHQEEQEILVVKLGDAIDELEAFEHVTGIGREIPDVGDEVLADVLGVVEEPRDREKTRVVKRLLALALQEDIELDALVLALGVLFQDNVFGRLQDAIKPAQQREGEDHLPVIRLLVIAAKQVGY